MIAMTSVCLIVLLLQPAATQPVPASQGVKARDVIHENTGFAFPELIGNLRRHVVSQHKGDINIAYAPDDAQFPEFHVRITRLSEKVPLREQVDTATQDLIEMMKAKVVSSEESAMQVGNSKLPGHVVEIEYPYGDALMHEIHYFSMVNDCTVRIYACFLGSDRRADTAAVEQFCKALDIRRE